MKSGKFAAVHEHLDAAKFIITKTSDNSTLSNICCS